MRFHNPNARWQPYERQVDAAPRPGFVFFKAALGGDRATLRTLAAHGYRRVPVGPFLVYAPPTRT